MTTVGILIVSDRAFTAAQATQGRRSRASREQYEDKSGPALREAAERRGWNVTAQKIVPDSKPAIQKAIRSLAKTGCEVILTTGGTGVTRRDVTPDAISAIARCELPGFGEVMRAESLKITPHAILSRTSAFVVGKSLVVCLPGSPKGTVECLEFVAAAIPHAVDLLQEKPAKH